MNIQLIPIVMNRYAKKVSSICSHCMGFPFWVEHINSSACIVAHENNFPITKNNIKNKRGSVNKDGSKNLFSADLNFKRKFDIKTHLSVYTKIYWFKSERVLSLFIIPALGGFPIKLIRHQIPKVIYHLLKTVRSTLLDLQHLLQPNVYQ